MNLHLPTLQQMFRYLIIAGLMILTLVAGVMFYWTTTGNDVLDVKNAPVPVRTIRDYPTADGVVILKVDYCKLVKATGQVRVSFVSPSREVFLPISIDTQPPQCRVTETPVLVPHELVPGEYYVKFHVTYRVNPLKEVIEEFNSRKFEVVQ